MKSILKKLKLVGVSLLAQVLGFFILRDEKYIAFGSWCGELYIDNSRYLFEYAVKNLEGYKLIWVGKKELLKELPVNEQILLVEKDSLKSIGLLLKCKYMFCTQMHRPDICSYNVYKRAVIYSLDHGIPLKKWAQDAVDYKGEFDNIDCFKKLYQKIIGENIAYDYFVTASPLHDKANLTALAYRGAEVSKNLPTGTPRNDMLVNYENEKAIKLKEKYAEMLNFSMDKKIIMYLPTYRRQGQFIETFVERDSFESKMLDDILEKNNAIIIEKNHFVTDRQGISSKLSLSKNVIKLTQKVDLQEMLMFTDIQISDYSGCCLDFLLLNRPIIYYAYDYQVYKNKDSGLYYEIEDFAAGPITKTFQETLEALENILCGNDLYFEKRLYVRQKYLAYEKGEASKQIIENMLKSNG